MPDNLQLQYYYDLPKNKKHTEAQILQGGKSLVHELFYHLIAHLAMSDL